ncbi:extracellular solute-binding protein [Mesorhizobium sp. B4-1-4]|uniref:extracellular solute-binding protein n=1 Tax=Mesorhizobium sp. B4-1-4 TaxID=2589888 RepID=UPI0015E2BD8B|nr:extracellular solute-binding protein [Mesorhizobium sp. B4-1-4]UCI32034.1 extracellular solute-binding protein [Mesorhizobium sp. B4-1-4]
MAVPLALGITSQAHSEDLKILYSASNLMVPVHDAFKKDFEGKHSSVSVKFEPTLEYPDAMASTLRGSIIGILPDVGYYGISDICFLAERGIPRPLDPIINADPDWKTLGMPDSALDVAKCKGVSYGIPFSASYMVVIFNKKLVEQAGGDPGHLPTTWPEIIALAKRIHSQSGGIALNYEASSSWSFMTLVLSQGGKILTPDGKDIAFDSDAGLRALQIVADIGAARAHIDLTKAQQRQSFNAGTLGILVDSSSGLAAYKRAANGKFDLLVVPFPISSDGKVPASGMAGVLTAKDSGKQKLAWDYMKYAASVDGQTDVGRMTGFLPFNETAMKQADKLGDYYDQRPELKVAAQSVKNATAWPSFPGPNGLKIHQLIIDYMQKVYTGVLAPDVALAGMAKDTRALIE